MSILSQNIIYLNMHVNFCQNINQFKFKKILTTFILINVDLISKYSLLIKILFSITSFDFLISDFKK